MYVMAASTIPTWLGVVGALIVIATALGATVAVYRTSIFSTSLKESRATISDLRGEIVDYERREAKHEADIRVLQSEKKSDERRIVILEDLITKRQDDDAIRSEIAAVKKVVDENVLTQLTAIFDLLQGTDPHPLTGAKP